MLRHTIQRWISQGLGVIFVLAPSSTLSVLPSGRMRQVTNLLCRGSPKYRAHDLRSSFVTLSVESEGVVSLWWVVGRDQRAKQDQQSQGAKFAEMSNDHAAWLVSIQSNRRSPSPTQRIHTEGRVFPNARRPGDDGRRLPRMQSCSAATPKHAHTGAE